MSTMGFKKIEVARGLDRVTNYINKGPLVPFSRGGGGWLGVVKACSAPENFEISKPKKCDFQFFGD